MRTIDTLARQYPNKTGAELLALQEEDKKQDQLEIEKSIKEELAIIKDITDNGGFFKGRFGMDQRFFYKINKIYLSENQLYVDVEKATVFLEVEAGGVRIEKRTKEYAKYDTFGFNVYTRITEGEYKEFCDYLYDIAKFWPDLDN